ncbi:MAG TPA: preprotein translocase subunit SecY [Candidatus Brocadiia bacterium]|nr:preprotein translocase subunit SecY [Candidatus Brocadiia bacterium]
MFDQFRNIFRIAELRRKILITVGLLAFCRLGVYVPLPGVDTQALKGYFQQLSHNELGRVLGMVNLFAGGALGQGAIFGLGIMPYISASIIFQLLATSIPSLERLQKEGEAGRKRINQYTRIATVFLCLFQAFIMTSTLYKFSYMDPDAGVMRHIVPLDIQGVGFQMMAALMMTSGTVLLMWIGEQIDEHGIGNGISLIIMIGIMDRLPAALTEMYDSITMAEDQQSAFLKVAFLMALFIGVVVVIVYITLGQRRIPVQQAKHVRGPRVYGGQKQFLPLRVNQAGVMPIIFAQALLTIPALMATALHQKVVAGSFLSNVLSFISDAVSVSSGGLTLSYIFLYSLLILLFCYFWTAITFNPQEMADNMKNMGSFIPGIRPGRRTAEYLEDVMMRVTLAGSVFLIIVAVLPQIVASAFKVQFNIAGFYGGTSLLIVVGVALDAVQRIESYLVMHRYGGFGAGGSSAVRRRRIRGRR